MIPRPSFAPGSSPRVALALAVCLMLALGLAPPASSAAPGDRKDVVIRGLVSDPAGRPITGAQVTASGSQDVMTMSNSAGRFALTLRPGTIATIERARVRWTIEARDHGKRIPLLGGADRLEVGLGVTGTGDDARVAVSANDPALERMLQRQLAMSGAVTAWGEVEFSRRRVTHEVKADSAGAPRPVAATTAPAAAPRPAPNATGNAPRSAAKDSAEIWAIQPPRGGTGAPPRPAASALPPAATTETARPPAVYTKPPAPAPAPTPAPASAAKPPTPTPAPANAARPPAPARVAPAAPDRDDGPAPAAPLMTPSRRSNEPTALELLEEVKRHGSLTAAERYADSTRAAARERERLRLAQVHQLEEAERAVRKEEERGRRLAAERARDSLQAERRREAVEAARRHDARAPAPAARETPRASAPVPVRGAGDARAQSETRPMTDAERRESERRERETRKLASRLREDSLRAEKAEADARLLRDQRNESARLAARRDSVVQAMRMKESLRRAALVRDSLRAIARRDSLLAARPAPAPLRRPPPRAGRTIAPDSDPDTCACRIRGTVEIDMDGRLETPPRVVVGVYGTPIVSGAVRLFMGSPRSFQIARAPCGRISLELTIASRIRFVPRDPRALTDLRCRPGELIQPRIVLVPAGSR